MSKKLSTLSAGSLVKLNENGVAKKFIVLGHNHYGKGEVVLLRKDTFAPRQWTGSYDGSYNNCYNGSDMDMFCNVQYPLMLDPAIQGCLIDVPIPTARGAVYGGTVDKTVVNLMRHGFLLSAQEATATAGLVAEGSAFTYLSGTQANRIAYHDETSTAVGWWLRSPYSNANRAYYVGTDGALDLNFVYYANYYCPRPALALSSEILVSNTASSGGCYVVEDAVIAGVQYQRVNGVWRRMM